jgi:NCAIR mutase (PurE)-related protein
VERKDLEKLLRGVKSGKLPVREVLDKLGSSYESLGFATLDVGRETRTGVSEVIFGEGKTPAHIVSIAEALYKRKKRFLATRVPAGVFDLVKEAVPRAKYNEAARAIFAGSHRKRGKGRIVIVSAGTSDIPVAEEAAVTAEFLGNRTERIYDVGVAGLHRLFGHLPKLKRASVIIVVAGMEGALASVVSGLVNAPVIGVPTSVGYGASFKGISSLLTMLNSCSPGVTVVNIDNGFGAAVSASLINAKRSNA